MRTVPPRMPSQSSSSVSTWSVVRTSLTVPPTSAARRVAVGVALARSGRPGCPGRVARRRGTAARGTRPRPPDPRRRARRGRRRAASRRSRVSASGRWLTRNAPSATSNAPSANGSASASARTNSTLRVAAARFGEHALGEVDAGDVARRAPPPRRTARPGRSRRRARACPAARAAASSNGSIASRGRARHQRVVGAGAGAPAARLERLEVIHAPAPTARRRRAPRRRPRPGGPRRSRRAAPPSAAAGTRGCGS